jgi:hypothetical protein
VTPANGEGQFHADFRLSVTQALGDQLLGSLGTLGRAPLSEASLLQLRELPGVYQLYHKGEFVYVGKADKSLPVRIRKHSRKISGRSNISLEDMSFCCLYVAEDFTALAPEKLLINRYTQCGQAPWNRKGFGSNDPGKRRDHTMIKANHFDNEFPADLNRLVDNLPNGEIPMSQFLREVKKNLPFTFRYANTLGSAADVLVTVPDDQLTADEAFSLIARYLPAPWQIVALLGYAIMYPDSPAEYASARRYYRRVGTVDAVPALDAPGDIEELEDHTDE